MFRKYLKICGFLLGAIYLFFPVVASAQSTGESEESLINSYRLGPGDVIDIQVFGEPDLSGHFKLNEDGVVHYAEHQPKDHASEPFDIYQDRIPAPPPAPPEPVVTNTYGPGIDPPEKPDPGPTPQELEVQKRQLCERGRYLLNVLVPRPRAVLVGPDGTPRVVTDTERQDYLEEGNRLVSRYCPGQ